MPTVIFQMEDGTTKECEAPEDMSLMEIARASNVEEIEGACGGAMACATCHLYVHPDWAEKVNAQGDEKCDEEEDMLDLAFDVRDESRLCCQIHMTPELDGLIVALPGVKTEW